MLDDATRRANLELSHIRGRSDRAAWLAAWRARERWYDRWDRAFQGLFMHQILGKLNPGEAIKIARKQWKVVGKAQQPPPPPPSGAAGQWPTAAAVAQALSARVAVDQFVTGAQALYTGLTLDESETAGQFTLDALGLNRTFRWAGYRDFVRDQAAVHGSKIVEQSVRGHIGKLADIAIRATDPAAPKTIGDITKEVRSEWEQLTRAQAVRIARTESANIWERTNWYAMRANGVDQVMWLIAAGPAIGRRAGPVCEICLEAKANSPYKMDALTEIPPAHPNCRCTLVPVLSPTWLPPAKPWTGSEAVPAIFTDPPGPAPVAKARRKILDPTQVQRRTPGWSMQS